VLCVTSWSRDSQGPGAQSTLLRELGNGIDYTSQFKGAAQYVTGAEAMGEIPVIREYQAVLFWFYGKNFKCGAMQSSSQGMRGKAHHEIASGTSEI
jgi:hypothetical protein